MADTGVGVPGASGDITNDPLLIPGDDRLDRPGRMDADERACAITRTEMDRDPAYRVFPNAVFAQSCHLFVGATTIGLSGRLCNLTQAGSNTTRIPGPSRLDIMLSPACRQSRLTVTDCPAATTSSLLTPHASVVALPPVPYGPTYFE